MNAFCRIIGVPAHSSVAHKESLTSMKRSVSVITSGCFFLVCFGLLGRPGYVHSQDASNGSGQEADAKPTAFGLFELQSIVNDTKLSDEIGLSPEQRKTILVAMQKYRDASMKGLRAKPGERISSEEMKELMDTAVRDAKEVLSKDQQSKLTEHIAKKRAELAAQPRARSYSPEQYQEMSKLRQIQTELMRLSFDTELADKLGLTAEQRVELSEVQRKYRSASEELRNGEERLDIGRRNEVLQEVVMSSQAILTPEQSEKLSLKIRIEQLRRKHGDEFAMINGLAEDFGLDDKAQVKLSETIEEVRKEYYDDWIELKKKSMKSIISELPRKHREEVEAAVRDFVEEDPRDKMNRFRFVAPTPAKK
ncbi:type 2 periplasmic-binding domain-containing protein [Rhodopirellula baltica]